MDAITVHESGTTYDGKQAIATFQVRVLVVSLRLYRDTGMIPTRGMGLGKMLALATQHTGKSYPRSKRGIEPALADLGLLLEASWAALAQREGGDA